MKQPKATASDVRTALAKRFDSKAWALFEEVGNATGTRCNRHADAVAVGLWPSRGLEIHGIEIKVSRSDWTKELAMPEKSDPIQKYCDRWWVAVGSGDIVRTGELPPTWGLLELRGDKLVCVTEAPQLTPEPLTRSFVAALLRRAAEGVDAIKAEARRIGFEAGVSNGPDEHQSRMAALQRDMDLLRRNVQAFEVASGVSLERAWLAGEIGKAVKEILSLRHGRLDADRSLEQLGNLAASVVERVSAERKALAKAREIVERNESEAAE